MNCDSLIFDLDGTLWDASEAVSQSWAHTLRNTYQVKNPPSIAEIQSIMGLSAREIATGFFPVTGKIRMKSRNTVCAKNAITSLCTGGGCTQAWNPRCGTWLSTTT